MALTVPKPPTLKKSASRAGALVTGTGYAASPAIPVPPDSFKEIGSQRGSPLPDLVPALANRQVAVRTYNSMINTDVSVRIGLRAGKAPVYGADYYIDPFDERPENQVVAEFCSNNIFNAPGSPWLVVLQEICRFLENGFSIIEPVFENREWAPKKTQAGANRRIYTMIRKLPSRPATTIGKFEYDDNGGPVSVQQNAVDAKGNVNQVDLPIEKLIIFSFEGQPGNLEGQSILRSAYEHWYYKQHLYKIDAIQKERHGIGIPDIELQPGYTSDDKKIAHELGKNLRTNENAYIVRTPALKIGFAEIKTQLVDALKSAEHHDNMIMKNVLLQFLNMGAGVTGGGGGGRATGATDLDMFLKSMRYVANLICDYFNLFLIPKLVAYNFQTDYLPRMKVRNIGETKDLQMWAAAMSNLINQNAITVDDETEQYIRSVIDFPQKLRPRPLAATVSNVKEQYLLRDNPDTAVNEDLAGQAALQRGQQQSVSTRAKTGNGATGTGVTTGNINKGTPAGQ